MEVDAASDLVRAERMTGIGMAGRIRRLVLPTAAAAAIGVGVFGLAAVGNDDQRILPRPTTTSLPSTTDSPPTSIATTPSPPPDTGQLEPSVRMLDGAEDLRGSLVITTFPSSNQPRTVWTIESGQLASLTDVPLAPGDWPHLLIVGGNHIAFTAPPDANLIRTDLEQSEIGAHPARYLIPGKTPAVVWTVNAAITQITAIDMIDGTAEQTIDLPANVNWVMGAVADGFVVVSGEPGQASYWQAGEEPVQIPLPSGEQSDVRAMGGNKVAIVSPGPTISPLDLKTEQRTDVQIDIGDQLASVVCISPNQQFALVVGSPTGSAVVVDFRAGTFGSGFATTEPFHGAAWTGDTQFVYVDGDRIVASDAAGGPSVDVALLSGTNWSIAGSATAC